MNEEKELTKQHERLDSALGTWTAPQQGVMDLSSEETKLGFE